MSAAHEITSPGAAAADLPAPGGSPGAPRPWAADPYSEALVAGRGPLFLRRGDGWLLPLEVERWCAGADAADMDLLERCEGAVLDAGCGPGRLVPELAPPGLPVLGVDVSEAAVARTVRLGGRALRRSVFEPLPAEGRWDTVLLVDGNIGIGGDPVALLRRMSHLLRRSGLLLAETDADGGVDERVTVRVVSTTAGPVGPPFPWARLGTPALLRLATRAGWLPERQWTAGGRSFVALRNRGGHSDRSRSSTAEPPNSTAVITSQR
jgi:SAM-dependent methyltransferase